jgi:hypothetical protein
MAPINKRNDYFAENKPIVYPKSPRQRLGPGRACRGPAQDGGPLREAGKHPKKPALCSVAGGGHQLRVREKHAASALGSEPCWEQNEFINHCQY